MPCAPARRTCCACGRCYRRPPDALSVEELQAYLLHLITERKLAYASVNQAACAFRFLFREVLGERTLWLEIPMAKVPKRLPLVFSRGEVVRLFDACANPRNRTLLMTTYAAGLRVSEVCALQLADIESAPDRMCLKVRYGKGGKDRTGCFRAAMARGRWRSARRNASTGPRATPRLQAHPPLRAARAALDTPAPEPAVIESVAAFLARIERADSLACPRCGHGHFVVTEPLAPVRPPAPISRGPPR